MDSLNNTVSVELGETENICFVVMPFDSLFQVQYERVIRPAVEELGVKCVRGDEIYSKPQIMSDIWSSIRKSRFLIAELTGRNANVFYEVGLAHAIGKPIILLTRNESDVPFDLRALRYRYYNVNDPFWGDNLRGAIQSMVKSILEQPELPTYLEGITVKPQVINMSPKVEVAEQREAAFFDVSGNWKVSFEAEDTQHQGIVYITQQKETLSATMTITYEQEQIMSVVQEVLTGAIKGKQISLTGISYTYIHQGASKRYALDNFMLELNSEKSKMEGHFFDEGDESPAIFIKEENVAS